jgi:uncharacterized protein YdeI (YjbR/CyaY-like superfamily)
MEVLQFPDPAAWEAWLAQRHATSTEAWLRIAKKGSGLASIAIADALDVALCYGWIDGQRRSLDEVSFLQRYCPRRPRSSWSQVNVEKVAALTAAGRMRPPGIAQVEAAKADGRWAAAYPRQRDVTVPPELAAALAGDPAAEAAFKALKSSDRYVTLLPLLRATNPEARARQVARVVERLKE